MLTCSLCSSVLPTEPLPPQHIRVCHLQNPNFSIQCIVRGCCRTFANYHTFQNHLLKHRSDTTLRHECTSIDRVQAVEPFPLITESTSANLEAVANTSIDILDDQSVADYCAKWILQMREKYRLTR